MKLKSTAILAASLSLAIMSTAIANNNQPAKTSVIIFPGFTLQPGADSFVPSMGLKNGNYNVSCDINSAAGSTDPAVLVVRTQYTQPSFSIVSQGKMTHYSSQAPVFGDAQITIDDVSSGNSIFLGNLDDSNSIIFTNCSATPIIK